MRAALAQAQPEWTHYLGLVDRSWRRPSRHTQRQPVVRGCQYWTHTPVPTSAVPAAQTQNIRRRRGDASVQLRR